MRYLVLALGLLLCESTSAAAVDGAKRLQAEAPAKKDKPTKRLTDAQIKQLLIDESIAAYSGNCPCPYNRDRRGRSCGRRSAYSREGGEAPLCYPKDVTKEMVEAYRVANSEE
jgi:hypothetical protein